MNREKVVGNIFNMIFAMWCLFDIFLRTKLVDKINNLLIYIFNTTKIDVNRYVDITVLVCIVTLIVFLQKYTKKEMAIILLLMVPIAVATYNSQNNQLVPMMLFIVGAKYADFDKVINIYFYILLISICIVITLCFMGILPDYIINRGGIIRHSWGFEHPNRFGMLIFQLMACFCYIDRDNNYKGFKYLLLVSAFWFVYRVPNSQTAYICILLLLLLVVIQNIYDKYSFRKKRIIYLMAILSVAFNVITVISSFYNPKSNSIYNKIDIFLSHRFLYCYKMYKYYGVSWWGQRIQTLVKDTKYVGVYRQWYLDNAYISILLRFGIIVYLIISIYWSISIFYNVKYGNYVMVAILFTYSIYGIMTTGFYNMSYNVFLIAMAYPIYQKKYRASHKHHKIIVNGYIRKKREIVQKSY